MSIRCGRAYLCSLSLAQPAVYEFVYYTNYKPLLAVLNNTGPSLPIASGVMAGFRQTLYGLGFTEIQTPKIVASATESGANVFRLDYFGRDAFLAQSPQFYKQIMVGVFGRVFEVVVEGTKAVGVFEDPETVTPYAQELGIKHMPILLDGFAEATMEYNVMTIPSTIFINREGRIAASEFGAVGRSRLEVGLAKIGLGTMPDVDSASDPGATGIPVEGCALGDC